MVTKTGCYGNSWEKANHGKYERKVRCNKLIEHKNIIYQLLPGIYVNQKSVSKAVQRYR